MLIPAPMLAATARAPFDAPDYSFEVKWDGIRCLCLVDDGRIRLFSRHGRDITHRFPELGDATGAFTVPKGVFDGELCVFTDGKPDFEAVRRRNVLSDAKTVAHAAASNPAVYIVFDVLRLGDDDTMPLPWLERRRRLEDVWKARAGVQLSDTVAERGTALFDATRRLELEGIVAKHHQGPYVPGRRTRHWLKVRHQKELDAVIGGYARRSGGDLASLALGLYVEPAGDDGLVYIGNVGTGFDEATRAALLERLQHMHTVASPFRPPTPDVISVRPELVCRVTYLELTPAGRLRHAVFRGLLPNKRPDDCTWSKHNTE